MMDKILDKRPLDPKLVPLVSLITKQRTQQLSNVAADMSLAAELVGVPRDVAPHVVMNCLILAAINLGMAVAFEDGREPSREVFLGACDEAFTEMLAAHRKLEGGGSC